MSIPVRLQNLNQIEKDRIMKELKVVQQLTEQEKKYNVQPKEHKAYYIYKEQNVILLPMYYYRNVLKRNVELNRPKVNMKFIGNLRDSQVPIVKESIEQLKNTKASMISVYMGMGKTVMSIFLATHSKLKTIVLCHIISLLDQWKAEIERHTNCKAQIVTSSDQFDENASFYIMNPLNIPKRKLSEYKRAGIGMCIVDELHTICTLQLSQALYYITPIYIIGLSATPYRYDGLDKLMDIYFGTHRITRKLKRYHKVFQIHTDFKPEKELMNNGSLNWNSILTQQADCEERNQMIVNIVKEYKDRYFLLLVKRVTQGRKLAKMLRGENVITFLQSENPTKITARIVIGTTKKLGAGFSYNKLNSMILCADIVNYFEQPLGRVFRTEDVEPIVFDIVDNFDLLRKHAKQREKIYKEIGGEITIIKKKIIN